MNRKTLDALDSATVRRALALVVEAMDVEEWSPDTLDAIGSRLRADGFVLSDEEAADARKRGA
jgi:hypothetical protein